MAYAVLTPNVADWPAVTVSLCGCCVITGRVGNCTVNPATAPVTEPELLVTTHRKSVPVSVVWVAAVTYVLLLVAPGMLTKVELAPGALDSHR